MNVALSFLDRYHEPIESYLTILSVDIDIEAGKNEIRIEAEGEHEDAYHQWLCRTAAFVFTTYTMGVVTVSCRYSIMMREVPGDVYPPIRGKRYVITGSLYKEVEYE